MAIGNLLREAVKAGVQVLPLPHLKQITPTLRSYVPGYICSGAPATASSTALHRVV